MEVKTNMEVRAANTKRIFSTLYFEGPTTKQELARKLSLSLPTVNSIVSDLFERGLLKKGKVMESTGGRRATCISPVWDSKISIGLEVSGYETRILLINMKPQVVVSETYPCGMNNSDDLWTEVNERLMEFIDRYAEDKEKLLGVAMALPLPMENGKLVKVKSLPAKWNVDIDEICRKIEVPIRIYSSAKVAAIAQIWALNNRGSFTFMNIGSYIAGAIVYGGEIIEISQRHGEFGNMILDRSGQQKRLEEVCTGISLEKNYGMKFLEFLDRLSKNEEKAKKIWLEYLEAIACSIYNMHCMFNWEIVIGGSMTPYIQPYEEEIKKCIRKISNFPEEEVNYFRFSDLGQYGAATGAAMTLQDAFLNTI